MEAAAAAAYSAAECWGEANKIIYYSVRQKILAYFEVL